MRSTRFAVLDIGSNSVRLVVYNHLNRSIFAILNEKVFCGLGRGLRESGKLSPEGIKLALANIPRFVALARGMGVEKFEVLATAAVRNASDGADFVARLKKDFGLNVKTITGDEEARIGALGVISAIPEADGFVGDLGGGSLELTEIAHGNVGRLTSLPLGPQSVEGAIDAKSTHFDTLRAAIDAQLTALPWFATLKGRDFYAVGGAWRLMAKVHMTFDNYPLHIIHHYTIGHANVIELTKHILGLKREEYKSLYDIPARRREALPWAALLMERIFTLGQPRSLIFSSYGLREGAAYALLDAKTQSQDPLISGCTDLARRESRFPEHGAALRDWALGLWPEGLDETHDRLLLAVALVSDIAWAENPDYRADSAYSHLLSAPFVGLDHADRVFIALATATRYGGRGFADYPEMIKLLSPHRVKQAMQIGLALRLAHDLSGGTAELLKDTKLHVKDGSLVLHLKGASAVLNGELVATRVEQLAEHMRLQAKITVG